MTAAFVLVGLASLAIFAGLVLIEDRRRGGLIGQVGTAIGAIMLFATSLLSKDSQATAWPFSVLLAGGVGVLSAATGGMGYHLFLGRFTSLRAARGAFLCVSLGLAMVLGAALSFLS